MARIRHVLQEYGLRIFASAALFAFFMLFSSPWWFHRALEIGFRYAADAPVRLSVSTDCKTDLFNREKLLFTSLELPAGEKAGKVTLLIPPAANHIRGMRLEAAGGSEITLSDLTALLPKGVYRVDFSKDLLVNDESYRVSREKLSIPGKNRGVILAFPEKFRAGYRFRLIAFVISLAAALLLSLLFFWRVDVRFSRSGAWNVVFCFCALGLMLYPVMRLDIHSVLGSENRLFGKFPVWNGGKGAAGFPPGFERYLNDRFYGRNGMIELNTRLFSLSFLGGDRGGAYGRYAFYGKDGWMFSAGYGSVDMALNRNRFTAAELKTCAEHLDRLAEEFDRRYHAPVFVLLMPDKERVYPEHYPEFLLKQRQHPESRLEQLAGYLREHSRVKVIHPLPDLLARKKDGWLYYPTGTHQTMLGGSVSAAAIRRELTKAFPQLAALPENSVQWQPRRGADVDIAIQMGFPDPEKALPEKMLIHPHPVFRWNYETQRVLDVPLMSLHMIYHRSPEFAGRGLRLLVVCDSFWESIRPFLNPAASEQLRLAYVDGRDFSFVPGAEKIESFKPQAVVIETTERFLTRFLTIKYGE